MFAELGLKLLEQAISFFLQFDWYLHLGLCDLRAEICVA